MPFTPFKAFAAWRRRRRAIAELSRLSDLDLHGLGIGRADMAALAARGPRMSRAEVDAVVTGRHALARLADGEMAGPDEAAPPPSRLAA